MPPAPIKAIVEVEVIADNASKWTTMLNFDEEDLLKKIVERGDGRELLLLLLAGGAHSTFSSLEREGHGPVEVHYKKFIDTLESFMSGVTVNPWQMFG